MIVPVRPNPASHDWPLYGKQFCEMEFIWVPKPADGPNTGERLVHLLKQTSQLSNAGISFRLNPTPIELVKLCYISALSYVLLDIAGKQEAPRGIEWFS